MKCTSLNRDVLHSSHKSSREDSHLPTLLCLLVSLVFIAAGAVNTGFTGMLFSVPFILLMLFLFAGFKFRMFWLVVSACVISIVTYIKITQDSNPLVYPVVGHTVTLEGDWFAYLDGDWNYHADERITESYLTTALTQQEMSDLGDDVLKRVQYTKITNKRFTVIAVKSEYSSVSSHRLLVLRDDITQSTYHLDHSEFIYARLEGYLSSSYTSDELQSTWTNRLSMLMYWPVASYLFLTSII